MVNAAYTPMTGAHFTEHIAIEEASGDSTVIALEAVQQTTK